MAQAQRRDGRPCDRGPGPDAGRRDEAAPGGVRYRLTSPLVERYLQTKLEYPHEIVFVKSGVFLQTFFADAVECGKRLGLAVRNLAATDEPERIPACGIPVARVENFRSRLASDGRTIRVEE